jgi:hypothetical protein
MKRFLPLALVPDLDSDERAWNWKEQLTNELGGKGGRGSISRQMHVYCTMLTARLKCEERYTSAGFGQWDGTNVTLR